MSDRLHALTEINLDDIVGAFGWRRAPALAALARALLRAPARAFAKQMLEFDDLAGRLGLVEAARRTARLHLRELRVYGAENLPSGGFLALSNHPGLTDTLVLFTALGRPDLRTIALPRPFLLSLVNISRQLFFLPAEPSARIGLVRDVARFLHAGGAVMTFPAGRTEPDPAAYPGALDALGSWIDSAIIFARLAPGIPVIPVCVRGVAWRAAARHPIVRLRRHPDDRQLLASVLQLLWQLLFAARPAAARIHIGFPIRGAGAGPDHSAAVHEAVLEQMRELIRNPPENGGVSVL